MKYQMPENIHVVLMTPAYGGMCNAAYASSLAQWTSFHEKYDAKWEFVFTYNESLIQRARNHLVTQFLKIPTATHLFFVDADISFKVEDYVKMLEADKDIIIGAYAKKQINWEAVRSAAISGKRKLEIHASSHVVDLLETDEKIDFNKPFKVEHGGTGFMLIKRCVFEKLIPKTKKYVTDRSEGKEEDYNFFSVEIDEEGLLLSEDYYFCKEWRKIGGDIWCAPWVELIHYGTHPFIGKFVDDDYL